MIFNTAPVSIAACPPARPPCWRSQLQPVHATRRCQISHGAPTRSGLPTVSAGWTLVDASMLSKSCTERAAASVGRLSMLCSALKPLELGVPSAFSGRWRLGCRSPDTSISLNQADIYLR